MNCTICNNSEHETELHEGIYESKIVMVCKCCAEIEKIPLIKKPDQNHLIAAERMTSVRQRLEKLAPQKKPSKEQIIAHKNLAQIKTPLVKQEPDSLVENYFWEIKMARRRKKLSISQLSQATGIPIEIIDGVEKGQLPQNFEPIIQALENFLQIRLNKFLISKSEEEQEIIKQTKKRMMQEKLDYDEELDLKKVNLKSVREKKQLMEKVSKGEMDFSKKENIKDITLNDLIDLKKQKEKKEQEERDQQAREELLGDEVEFLD